MRSSDSEGPPRCLHLLPDTNDAGAENQARYLLAALRDGGELSPELVYFEAGRAHDEFDSLGIPLHQVPRKGRLRTDLIGRAMRLRRAFAARPPQILHTWQPEGNVIGLLAARGWSGARVVITHLNSWNARDYPGVMRLQRLLLGRADYAVSNSRGGAHLLAKAGLDTDRIALIRDGIPPRRVAVDASRREIRTAMGWEAQDVVAWVGRADDRKTTAQKGLETLFAAMGSVRARRPSARLVLIGPTGAELEANGFELPDWADALGWRPRPADLMNAADVVAIASRYEGFSNVAGEALMLGLPVVMTDCSDLCEAVSRAGGRVVAVADPEAMSAAIDALLARPPDRQHVRNVAAESISVERMVAAHLDVYRRLLCTK